MSPSSRHVWLLFAAALAATRARAGDYAEGGAQASRQLQNLVYYPHAGQFLLTPQFTTSLQNTGQTDNAAGTQTQSVDSSFYRGSLDLAYGIVDRLRVGVTESVLFHQITNTTNLNNGVQTESQSRGFSDPSFRAVYRWLESADQGLSADLNVSMTVPFGLNMNTANGRTGNNLSTGWVSTVSLPIFWRHWSRPFLGALEFGVTPQATRNYGGRASGSSETTSTLYSPYWTEIVTIQARFHLLSALYFQPGVSLNFRYSYNTATETPNAADTLHTVPFYAVPMAEVGYLVTERLLVSANVSYTDNRNSANPPSGKDTDSLKTQTVVSFQVRYQF